MSFDAPTNNRHSTRGTFTRTGMQIDKETGQLKNFDQFYDMVQNTGSQGPMDKSAAITAAAQQRAQAQQDFESAGTRFVESTSPTWIVQEQ